MISPGPGTLLAGAAGSYLLAAAAYGAHVSWRREELLRWGRGATLLGVAIHTVAIGVTCMQTHRTPFTNPAQTLSATAWCLALIYLIVDILQRQRQHALGAVALPAAFLCLFTGAVVNHSHPAGGAADRLLDTNLVSFHVVALLIAFALLVLAFGTAILYLVQHRLLKRKQFAGLFGKLPSLAALDHQGFALVALAFPLLTIGLTAGIVQELVRGTGDAWVVDPKILASATTWLVYGIYLGLHALAHWRGPRANYLLIGGLLISLVTYFIPSTAHRFD